MREHRRQESSLFLLRNQLAFASSTMRRGIRGFCHGDGSTSTHRQLHTDQRLAAGADAASSWSSSFLAVPSSIVGSRVAESKVAGGAAGDGAHHHATAAPVTLEQMILQLDLEEAAAARKARRVAAAAGEDCHYPRRMSCVNSSDHVLRSARDALSQYPRFSLDGRDAMYRASFSSYSEGMGIAVAVPRDGANAPGYHGGGGGGRSRRASAWSTAAADHRRARPYGKEGYEMDLQRRMRMPGTVAGESVRWCKPGIVAKLMGLEAVPVPVRVRGGGIGSARKKASGAPTPVITAGSDRARKQNTRRTGKEELEKERLFMALHGYDVASGLGRDNGDGLQFRFDG